MALNEKLFARTAVLTEELEAEAPQQEPKSEVAAKVIAAKKGVKALKTEILDIATNILALNAPKAASKLIQIMDSPEPIPQANMRIQAAQQILDRVGLGKTERLDINVSSTGGLFVIPAKKEVVIDGEYTEV